MSTIRFDPPPLPPFFSDQPLAKILAALRDMEAIANSSSGSEAWRAAGDHPAREALWAVWTGSDGLAVVGKRIADACVSALADRLTVEQKGRLRGAVETGVDVVFNASLHLALGRGASEVRSQVQACLGPIESILADIGGFHLSPANGKPTAPVLRLPDGPVSPDKFQWNGKVVPRLTIRGNQFGLLADLWGDGPPFPAIPLDKLYCHVPTAEGQRRALLELCRRLKERLTRAKVPFTIYHANGQFQLVLTK